MSGASKKRVGVALSGGFIRGVAQIGVLEVLNENQIPIDMISGCSSGSGIAAAYAAGELQKMKSRLLNGRRRDYWQVIFEPTIPREGLLKGKRNREFFAEFVGEKDFADLKTPLLLAATDLRAMQPFVLEQGNVATAVQACTSVPGVFVPVRWGNKLLVDGGSFNQLPTGMLYGRGIEYVIAVDVSQPPNPITRSISNIRQLLNIQPRVKVAREKEQYNILQLIFRSVLLSSSHIKNFSHTNHRYDVLIRPDLLDIRRWHVSRVEYLIAKGRAAAEEALPRIRHDLGML